MVNLQKYINLIIKILLLTIVLIGGHKFYLEPLYNFIEKYYSSKIEVIGRENIPKDNGYVIISNHNFITDFFVIKSLMKKILQQ